MSQAPKPIAEGSLAATPLAHVLLSIMKRDLDGTLAVWPDGEKPGQDRILFKKGMIVAARLLEPASSLERGLLPLFRRRSPYAFYPADLIGEADTIVRGHVDPAGLMAAALRGGAPKDVVDGILAKLGSHLLRIKGYSELSRFTFLRKEMAFIEVIRADPAPAAQLIARSGDERMARRLIYLLAISGHLETFERPPDAANEADATSEEPLPPSQTFRRPSFSNIEMPSPASGAPSAAPQTPSPTPAPEAPPAPAPPQASEPVLPGAPDPAPRPPPGLAEDLKERWEKVADLHDAFDNQNYFEILEVGEAPTEVELRDAYFSKVKVVHPDRLPPELVPLKPWADRVFHYLTEAKDSLEDDQKRIDHIKAVRSGGGTPAADRKVAAIVGAAMEYQKVEILVRRKEWDEALRILELNIALSPDEADYYIMKAQVLHDRHGAKGPDGAEMNRCLDTGLSLYPKHGRGNFLKANILKRSGQEEEAIQYFRKVLAISPRHLEAGREVRLYEMRHGKSKSDSDSPKKRESLFSKLLGKK